MTFPFYDVESDMDNLLDNDSAFGVAMHQGDDVCKCTEQGNIADPLPFDQNHLARDLCPRATAMPEALCAQR